MFRYQFENEHENQVEKTEVSEKASLEELGEFIEVDYWQNLDEICAQEAIQPDELPAMVDKKVKNLFEMLGTCQYPDNEMMFLFKLYHALQEYDGNNKAVKKTKQIFLSFGTFKNKYQSYFEDRNSASRFYNYFNTTYRQANSSDWVMIENYKQPYRKDISKPIIIREKDEAGEQWVKIKEKKNQGSYYISPKVNDEFNSIRNINIKGYNNFYHSTSSAALNGISRQKGLLSRSRMSEKGESIVSGERQDSAPRVFVESQMNHGAQYSFVSWFDEFPINIEISGEKAKNLKERFAPEWGISLGHEVPIEYFSTIYAPAKNIEQVKKWTEVNCPSVKVYSIEVFWCKEIE